MTSSDTQGRPRLSVLDMSYDGSGGCRGRVFDPITHRRYVVTMGVLSDWRLVKLLDGSDTAVTLLDGETATRSHDNGPNGRTAWLLSDREPHDAAVRSDSDFATHGHDENGNCLARYEIQVNYGTDEAPDWRTERTIWICERRPQKEGLEDWERELLDGSPSARLHYGS